MKISYSELKRARACQPQLDKFAELFGTESPVMLTRELCLIHAWTFNWTWAAAHLLSAAQRADYEVTYDLALANLRAICEDARAICEADYKAPRAVAWATYTTARAAAWDTWADTRAVAFFDASQL